MYSEDIAWKRLTGYTHERIYLITTLFSDHDQIGIVPNLSRDDARNLVNMIGEVCTTHFHFWGKDRLTPTQSSTPCQLGIG